LLPDTSVPFMRQATLARGLLASEGISGLYRGFLPRWAQASLFSACVISLYEYLKDVCRKERR
jgi:hypothetical protein